MSATTTHYASQPHEECQQVYRPKSTLAWCGFVLLNLMIVFHLFAIIAAPVSVSPSSGVEQGLWETLSPYVQLFYLNNGYHFFAPNPEGSNSVRYIVEKDDGTIVEGKFPNKQIWPRLLYHRYFMLSETLGQMEEPYAELMTRDFARQLCREYEGDRITLQLEWHDLARRERILAGGTLYDQDLYEVTPLGTFTWNELSKSSKENVANTDVE